MFGLGVLVSGFLGLFAGYMKKKGENLATHEDIGKLVEQMSAVTKATKDIEAKISSDMWDRQRRWELKREVLLEATRTLADVEDGLHTLDSLFQVEHKEGKKTDDLGWMQLKHDKMVKWSKASTAFDEARLLVLIAGEKATSQAFEEFGRLINFVAAKITPGNDLEIYKKSTDDRLKKRLAVQAAVRKELGIA